MKTEATLKERKAVVRGSVKAGGARKHHHVGNSKTTVATKKLTVTAPFYVISAATILLVSIGLLAVFSATSTALVGEGLSPWAGVTRQIIWVALGIVGGILAYNTPSALLQKYRIPVIVFGLGLLALPFFPKIGHEYEGARAWIKIGGQTFQPSEITKLCLFVFLGSVLGRNKPGTMVSDKNSYKALLAIGAVCFGMVLQEDLGGALVVALSALMLMYFAGVSLFKLTIVSVGGGLATLGLILSSPRRTERWTSFLDVEASKKDEGYQVWQSLIGFGEGGWWGKGVGGGSSKWGFLPLPHSDFIYSVVGEELGFIGSLTVLLCFIGILIAGFQIAASNRSTIDRILVLGITLWLTLQALINMGGVVALLPVTGITLPFVSFGGSSIISCLTGVGLMLGVSLRSR